PDKTGGLAESPRAPPRARQGGGGPPTQRTSNPLQILASAHPSDRAPPDAAALREDAAPPARLAPPRVVRRSSQVRRPPDAASPCTAQGDPRLAKPRRSQGARGRTGQDGL